MKSLIRNCSHGSEVYLLQETGGTGNVESMFKSSSMPEGVKNLRQELEGVNWYNSKNSKIIKAVIDHETSHYISIKYDYVRGENANFQDGYWVNRNWINLAIEHYCDIWRDIAKDADALYPLHGDLSLDNFIFSGEGPVILDWEHFLISAAPLGFDGLYLIFEALWFEVNNRAPSRKTLSHLASMIDLMGARKCLDIKFLDNPLSQVIQFIQSHLSLWGAQLENCRNKLPVLMFEDKAIVRIDNEIRVLINLES
tara:strand:+ start:3956 stop:4717 length:762 start_codon:yes stop_codon:yes gene_type:complete